MNWHPLLGFSFMMACLASFEAVIGNECLAWEIPLIIALISGACFIVYKIWRSTVYKYGNLQLSFINHLPQEEYGTSPIEELPFQIKTLPIGEQTVFLKIIARHGFPVKQVNARFLNADRSNADGKIIEITDMNDPYYGLGRQRDGNFGIEGEYHDVRVLSQGQGLYFEMNLTAHMPWKGILSFRAQDLDGFRIFARFSVDVREDAEKSPSPPIYPIAASASSVGFIRIIKSMMSHLAQFLMLPQKNSAIIILEF